MIKFSQILNEMAMSKEFIDNLRNEFLQIVSNTKKLTNYDDAMIVKKACIKWRDMLEEYLNQIRDDLNARKTSPKANTEWAEYHLNHLGPLWKFAFEVGHFPLESLEYSKKYYGKLSRVAPGEMATDEEIKGSLFNIEKINQWDAKVRRFARPAWKFLYELSDWTAREGIYGGGAESIKIQKQDSFLIDIDGISVKVVGFNDSDVYERKNFEHLKEYMKHYVDRARRVFPLLLRRQLPIVFNFTGGRGGEAAKYVNDHIEMNTWATGSPTDITRTIAHEMGHHIYEQMLSEEARKEWYRLIREDRIELDLRDIIRQWEEFKKTHDSGDKYGGEFDDHLKKTDPILYLQLTTLLHHPEYKHYNLLLAGNIKEYLDAGHEPIVWVPAHPVSGYGGKNEEEAFCEVIGNLVAYGPRTISPEIMRWFRTIVPEFKLNEQKHPHSFYKKQKFQQKF